MKRYLIILIILILTLSVITLFALPVRSTEIEKYLESYNTFIYEEIASFKEYPSLETGILTGSLYYQGAHKEPYPTNIEFTFFQENEELFIQNEKGYTNIIRSKEPIAIMKALKNRKVIEKILEITTKKDNIITLNCNNINEIFHQNFKTCKGKIKTTGLQKKINEIEIQLDDNILVLNDKHITYKSPYNDINLYLIPNGYSLNINNQLKIQKEQKEQEHTYHIIKNNDVFRINIAKDYVKFKIETPKDSFHSLELNLEEKVISKKKTNELQETIPFIKYLNYFE